MDHIGITELAVEFELIAPIAALLWMVERWFFHFAGVPQVLMVPAKSSLPASAKSLLPKAQ